MAIAKIYTDDTAARRHLERLLWPDGPVCPHCGTINEATLLRGKSTRPGVYKCRPCEKPFSVTVRTVFEDSKVPLHKWVYASHLLTSSKKGISSHQLMRTLGVSYKTAWFMSHRIREAMKPLAPIPMGGELPCLTPMIDEGIATNGKMSSDWRIELSGSEGAYLDSLVSYFDALKQDEQRSLEMGRR